MSDEIVWLVVDDTFMQEFNARVKVSGHSDQTASLDYGFADILCAIAFSAGMRIGELEHDLGVALGALDASIEDSKCFERDADAERAECAALREALSLSISDLETGINVSLGSEHARLNRLHQCAEDSAARLARALTSSTIGAEYAARVKRLVEAARDVIRLYPLDNPELDGLRTALEELR